MRVRRSLRAVVGHAGDASFDGVLIDVVEDVWRVDEDACSATYRHGDEYVQL